MRMPVIEALFPKPWTAAARRVLPSPSPQFTATAMWGPLLAWCALELLAESIDAANPSRLPSISLTASASANPSANPSTPSASRAKKAWRVAARIKVVLLSEAGVGREEPEPAVASETELPSTEPSSTPPEVAPRSIEVQPQSTKISPTPPAKPQPDEPAIPSAERVALAPSLWLDPDVRWLTGVHEFQGHYFLVRERYEELLWWLLLPALLRLAGEPAWNRAAIGEMNTIVGEALETAEAAGYRIDALLKSSTDEDPSPEVSPAEPQPNPEPTPNFCSQIGARQSQTA